MSIRKRPYAGFRQNRHEINRDRLRAAADDMRAMTHALTPGARRRPTPSVKARARGRGKVARASRKRNRR